MLINKNIDGKTYKAFISYAVQKSDAFMLVLKYCDAQIFDSKEHLRNSISLLPTFTPDEDTINRLTAMENKSRQDLHLFQSECLEFVNRLSRYLHHSRCNAVWPSTIAFPRTPNDYSINVYNMFSGAEQYLLQPQSYLGWRYPRYPEDLSFFKNNYCWAYASSHEEYIEIIPEDYEEYIRLKEMGIEFQDEYNPAEKKDMFYEAY